MTQLLCLSTSGDELHQMPTIQPPPLLPAWADIRSPLCLKAWHEELLQYPDRRLVEYITSGIQRGFRIGYQHSSHICIPAKRNMQSAYLNPTVVSEYIAKECSAGRLLGPVPAPQPPLLQINRFGVIPPKKPTGKVALDPGPIPPGK